MRSGMVGLAVFIAESVPSFSNILALIGGAVISQTSLILPALFYMKLCDKLRPPR